MDGDGCSAECAREADFVCVTLLQSGSSSEEEPETILPTVFEWLNATATNESLPFQVVPLGLGTPNLLADFNGNTDGEEFIIQLSFTTSMVGCTT